MNSSEQRFRYLQSCFEQVKMYETAKKIDPNYKKEGIEDALVQVAQAYRYGENVKKDYNEALYYLTQAIMLGEGEAARIYGDIFTYDQWIGKSRFKKTNPIDCYNHAIELWETAAKNGCYKSAWNHYMYVRQVPEKAKKQSRIAIELAKKAGDYERARWMEEMYEEDVQLNEKRIKEQDCWDLYNIDLINCGSMIKDVKFYFEHPKNVLKYSKEEIRKYQKVILSHLETIKRTTTHVEKKEINVLKYLCKKKV